MLQKLHIRNYAIIDHLEFVPGNQLNVITGETGAGKSILMGALSLILGDRADTNVLRKSDEKCVVEGFFEIEKRQEVKALLEKNDLDDGEELVIRREINTSGKSRAFVNDTPVTLNLLQQICANMVDLHQQFDNLELGQESFQRKVLDAMAGNMQKVSDFEAAYKKLETVSGKLQQLQQTKDQFLKELDYQKYLFEELEEADFQPNELEEISEELNVLSHAEEIKTNISGIISGLAEGEDPMVNVLKAMLNKLDSMKSFHSQIPELAERLRSAYLEIDDISGELEKLMNQVQYDGGRMEQINERLAVGYKLLKKHSVQTTAELLDIKETLETQISRVLNMDDEIEQLSKEKEKLFADADKIAGQISEKRKTQAPILENKVNGLLNKVGMPNALLKVEIKPFALNKNGKDQVEFLFDANKSGNFYPLRKVASGGELSRLMLCIKSLVGQSLDMPTLIFDEVDSGISGEASKQVGILLKQLGEARQVICITHQPQVAGKADNHFFVYKEIRNDEIKTGLRLLDNNERILAIAKMLGGEQPTQAAMENAREMIGN